MFADEAGTSSAPVSRNSDRRRARDRRSAEAQTVGMERRQERRAGRHERREVRRTGTTTGTWLSNSTGSAKSLIEPIPRTETVDVGRSPFCDL